MGMQTYIRRPFGQGWGNYKPQALYVGVSNYNPQGGLTKPGVSMVPNTLVKPNTGNLYGSISPVNSKGLGLVWYALGLLLVFKFIK